ncbi:MAG: enterochelin esterase [Deltaproteobacteria bacterium]|nr:enterochelin esterase [Deltaproteobacteria bacterium]MCB9788959.1 enterochelin esterase [Deltaproteobacteria bacterium]
MHRFTRPRGRVETLHVDSGLLADNLLGDPALRSVDVYLPEGYDSTDADYPLLVDLVGFTGSGPGHLSWRAFGENVPQRLDRLVAEGRMGPVVAAFPDCFTSLGGNQYVDSLAMGAWASWLTEAMIPALEERFRIRRGRQHRGVFGKSSGGFGALYHGMRLAEHWGAIASHSGDVGFDRLFPGDLPKTLDALARRGGLEGFLRHVDAAPKMEGGDFHTLMILAMGASYDPDPQAPRGIRLPVDLRTCALIPERWARWMAFDPLLIVEEPAAQAALRSLGGVYLDCGARDQYAIHYGTRALADRLSELGIPHVHEEFDDDHSGVDYRMDRSLPFLYGALTGHDAG